MIIIYGHVLLVLCNNTHSTVEVFLGYDNKKYKKGKKEKKENMALRHSAQPTHSSITSAQIF